MGKRNAKYMFIFTALIFIFGIYLPVFSAADTDMHYDAPLMDKQTAKNELLFFEDNSYNFKDIAGHWSRDEVLELSYMDIIKGYDDGTIQPERSISREEYVAMLVRAIGYPTDEKFVKTYEDVTDKHWSHKYIAAAKEHGLLSIFSGYYFYPYRDITREEMAVITSKAVRNAVITGQKLKFKDIPQYYRYEESIDRVTALGIITGLPDGRFDPKGKATRSQAAAVIGRVLKTRDESKETEDNALISYAADYEKSVLSSLSGNDLDLSRPMALSAGKEAGLNIKRSDQLNILYSKGLVTKKHMDKGSYSVSGKSGYLAGIEASYELVLDTGEKYTVRKTIYLKNRGDRWVVYNNIPEFGGGFDQGKKINLTWHYIGGSTPDMSKVKKISGLNVISPTWFTLVNEKGDLEDRGSISYVNWAHKNGYEVWALADNQFNSDLTNKLLSNAGARAKFIKNLIGCAKKYGLDGINIDFENMYTKDKNAFTQFIKELSKQTKANNLILSADVSIIAVNSNWSESFDRAALSKTVDYMALMTYDQHWGGSPVSGSVAQLSWVEQSLNRVLAEVPKEKLLLGVPFYTRLWKEEYIKGASKPVVTSKAISMSEAESTIIENKAEKTWDAVSGQYYATYKKGNATYKIWLEDEKSISLKAELVNKYGLAGIASWKYGLEKAVVWDAIAGAIID